MNKTQNIFQQFILSSGTGMTLTNGEIYTKIYISDTDIDESAWTEVDDSEIPAADFDLTAEEALEILLGGTA